MPTDRRQELQDIAINIEAKRFENQTPAPFENINLNFLLVGDLDEKKVAKALKLSIEKYCSVAEMVKSTAQIEYSFEIVDALPDSE